MRPSSKRDVVNHLLKAMTVAVALSLPSIQSAQASEPDELTSLSLEELTSIRVTSVSKRSESVADAVASVYVITGDSIRRSGATTLPEALRLAPNLQVAQVDARNYAVTSRGFNSAFENKLLVLIDGRSVYTPLFSGVFWDAQDVVLADIERIEVISGPGATLWGANAVNGVINIITKVAAATVGVLAQASADRDQRTGAVRYGSALPSGGYFRVYAKGLQLDDLTQQSGRPSLTGMRRSQVGFRADWSNADGATTVQGDAYSGALHQQGTAEIQIGGGNLLARKELRLPGGQEITLQAYFDHTERNQPNAFIEHLNTIDVQAQASLTPAEGHRLVVGTGYRLGNDHLENGRAFAFLPAELRMHWGNAFAQDEIDLTDNTRLIAGLKFEHNNYTGWEVLPTLRLAYKPTASSLLWGAVSRTVRAPSRIDRDFYSPSSPAVVAGVPQYAFAGGPQFQSEVARVAEVGYRIQMRPSLFYSVTAFVSDYERLRTLEPNPSGVGSAFSNLASGRTKGVEMWASWQPVRVWKLSAGLVGQSVTTRLAPDSKDASGTTGLATSDPNNYWSVRSAYDISDSQHFELAARHYGALDRPVVPAYTSLGANYSWQVTPNAEVSLRGENLTGGAHAEYGAAPGRTLYERRIGARAVWRF